MEDKASIIEKVYRDPAGLGSIQNTLKEVRKVDPAITIGQVKEWIEKNPHRKTNLTGFNSYASPWPKHEYQIDLFFHGGPERRGATEIQSGCMCY